MADNESITHTEKWMNSWKALGRPGKGEDREFDFQAVLAHSLHIEQLQNSFPSKNLDTELAAAVTDKCISGASCALVTKFFFLGFWCYS